MEFAILPNSKSSIETKGHNYSQNENTPTLFIQFVWHTLEYHISQSDSSFLSLMTV